MLAIMLDRQLGNRVEAAPATADVPVRADVSPKCFLHIPKSAGSSIHSAIEAALPQGSLAPQRVDTSIFCDFENFELMRSEARSQIAVTPPEVQSLARYGAVSGHFSLATLLQIADAPSICTVLREPRARLLSLYMYWRTPGTTEFWAPYSTTEYAQRPLCEFLSEPLLAPAVDNQVCRLLLYGDPRLPESSFAAQSDVESIAADAIERLDALGFVGVLELGSDVWQGLARLFDAKLEPARLNVTEELGSPMAVGPGEELVTAKALDLIEQRSAADLLVYDHALSRAGLETRERQRLGDGAFAHQLVKLGDLVGNAAAHAAEQAMVLEELRGQLQDQMGLHAQLDEARGRLQMRERTAQNLEDELCRRDEDLDRLRRWLDAVHSSASWRLTAPLRAAKHAVQRLQSAPRGSAIPVQDRSLLPGRSVSQVWWFALLLSLIIAVTDAILIHVVLIALLAAGPFCGLLTGRLVRTATTGIWALTLAVLLGFPDRIWGTRTQLIDLAAVACVALVSTFAATLIERRRYRLRED
jgi:hypothetical protein